MDRVNINKTDWRLQMCCRRSVNILLATMAFFVTLSWDGVQGQTELPSGLNFFGDFRLRYENTANQIPGTPVTELNDARNRGVVRFRAGVTKEINGLLKFGVRLATGSQDDPNTADVTLGAFVDDLEVSLDRAYLELRYQDFFFAGGKFANPFLRTDLVWDGDVNPQGIAGSYTFSGSERITVKLTGVYSIVDEQTFSSDSYMWGGQAQFAIDPTPDWSLTLAGAYCDYRIENLSNADAGDTRSNNMTSDGTAYLSDFDLFDAIAIVEYRGLSERYPIRFVADYVKNLGAEVDEDQGFTLDLYLGQASNKSDIRFRYGYSEAETDAVLAAFSNDNTTIATNYKQHTFTIDYVAVENTTLNLTWYLFRNNKLASASGAYYSDEFISRLRLNAMVNF
ncbi:hypothetical protein GWN28_04785 [candidate division KSB1 bacterium]|nr:hypothetical protein [Phycisphaerae bacterium]NIU10474.1 hypothetical protein [Phycisphaerae bacterium]NIW17710.1 hypothetical protein [candidate division KSB1 bacterium]NIX30106.1 hypothetical protein [Phycisphaerae bacterium]